MTLYFKTELPDVPLETVKKHFSRDLLESLLPAWPKAKILRYDGDKQGDEIHVQLAMPWGKHLWVTHVIASTQSPDEYSFIDESYTPPPPLSYWHHTHTLQATPDKKGTFIIDSIECKTKPYFLAFFMKWVLTTQFKARDPQYKAYFNNLKS